MLAWLPRRGAGRPQGSTLAAKGPAGNRDALAPGPGNVEEQLALAQLHMDDLVSVQVFCSDVSYYDTFNEVYRTYFTREFPARAFLGAGTLLFDARFEVQGIAVKR